MECQPKSEFLLVDLPAPTSLGTSCLTSTNGSTHGKGHCVFVYYSTFPGMTVLLNKTYYGNLCNIMCRLPPLFCLSCEEAALLRIWFCVHLQEAHYFFVNFLVLFDIFHWGSVWRLGDKRRVMVAWESGTLRINAKSNASSNTHFHVTPALFGFSATQAIVIPPISESLKRRRKVPLGFDISMSWACCLFTKPKMALKKRREMCREEEKGWKLLCA